MITGKINKQKADQPARKVVRVEIIDDYSALKAGVVVEMHPVLYAQLVKKGICIKTTKPLCNVPKKKVVTPVVDDNIEDDDDSAGTGNDPKAQFNS